MKPVVLSADLDNDNLISYDRWFTFLFDGEMMSVGKKNVGYETRKEAEDEFFNEARRLSFK